jgi:plastocyanin
MKMSSIIGLIVVVVVIAAGVFFLAGNKNTNTASTPSQSGPSTSQNSASQSAAATIKYTDSGFDPSSSTIKSGDSVTFTNNSSSAIQVDSNPHPAHTDNTELNVGSIEAGQSKTVTLTAKGTWGFHNHLSPSNTATITVQ